MLENTEIILYIYNHSIQAKQINLLPKVMNWKYLLTTLSLCMLSILVIAQSKKASLPYRFATQAEAQMLVTDIDSYTSQLNQFDIEARLQKPDSRKSQLLTLAMNEMQNWSDADKAKIKKAMTAIETEIQKQKYRLNLPKEIILLKSGMAEEGGAFAYTRENWIAIGEKALNELSEPDLQQLMAHELFHLLTRSDRAFKKAMYQTIGFTVLDNDINFPTEMIEKKISNPDISNYDSYATFTIDGKSQNCTMMIYTDKAYSGGNLFDYMKIGLIPLNEEMVPFQTDGKTIIYNLEDASDFYTQVGKNTSYVINPEEILADNFSLTLLNKTDGISNPEIISRIKAVLKPASK